MRKILMKAGTILMALTTMITMNACSLINQTTGNEVCKALSEKYGESFVATHIGNRIDTGSATLYIHPANNENIRFTAVISNETGEVEDNYIEKKVDYQVETIIDEAFKKKGITAKSISAVVTKNPIEYEIGDYTPLSFKEKYNFDHYFIKLALKDENYSAEDVLSAIKSAHEAVGVKFVITGYIFNEDNYEECVSDMNTYVDVSTSIIEENSPIYEFGVIAKDGNCSVTRGELPETMGRS